MKKQLHLITIFLMIMTIVIVAGCAPVQREVATPSNTGMEQSPITEPSQEMAEDIDTFDAEDLDLQEFNDLTSEFEGL